MTRALRVAVVAIALVSQIIAGPAQPAAAAPGDVIVDVPVPETDGVLWPRGIAKAIGFDGHYLYYAEWAGPVLHRIDVPPAGSRGPVTGHVDIPVQGAPSGIMAISYDAGRDAFWAVGGDGLSIYLLSKSGLATLRYGTDWPSSFHRATAPGTARSVAAVRARRRSTTTGRTTRSGMRQTRPRGSTTTRRPPTHWGRRAWWRRRRTSTSTWRPTTCSRNAGTASRAGSPSAATTCSSVSSAVRISSSIRRPA